MKLVVGLVVVGAMVGCSDAKQGAMPAESGGMNNAAGGGASGSAGTAQNTGGTMGTAGTGVVGADVDLPLGSSEMDGIVNLVDAAAAAELEAYTLDETLEYPTERHGLNKSLNLLLEHYEENYDFVFFFADHAVPASTNFGKFEAVTHKAAPGGVLATEIVAGGYETTGRVQGVIGFPYIEGVYPPLAHETLHNWAAFLDSRFGFGEGFDAANSVPLHWGYASINGQLGGFDGATLRCETPAGAMPPDCTPSSPGRTRYVMGAFGPNANAFRSPPYAPLELYLMGLAPASDVPPTIQMLTAAKFPEFDATKTLATVEASGVTTVSFADIQAVHGAITPLAPTARHFDAAFVVLSATPAPAGVMKDVADFAAVFGKRRDVNGWQSFEAATGGLATMNTALGPRRKLGNPPPPARAKQTCDALAQDCGRPELGCYINPPAICGLAGTAKLHEKCDGQFACAKGLDCIAAQATPTDFQCVPYCDSTSTTSATACATVCPGNWAVFKDDAGNVLGGLCIPQ